MAHTEADTCRQFVLPRLYAAQWNDTQIAEQRTFTDGRIVMAGETPVRKKQKRADYLLRYTRDFPLAVVEAKVVHKTAGDGMQQAKDYAQILGLQFAYATNGKEILEFDFLTGLETKIVDFPTPKELWDRLKASQQLSEENSERLLTPSYQISGKPPRYYQEIAINRTIQSVLQGSKRNLLTLATGTGKTMVAFQIAWKLWSARWNKSGEYRRPRVLFLADRNVLVDEPKDKMFAPFGDARHKIEGEAVFSREMYFAIYQALAEDSSRPGLYREYAPDFFDLIIVDECHRGSARDESRWREILEYFDSAYQVGMTATPLRDDNKDTYKYFGNPLYTYSLGQGIDDGFLAPYRVHRIVSTVDAAGWRPTQGERDRYGREIPDALYGTPEFERLIVLKARTEAIAKHLSAFMQQNGVFAKTIVFCVDQEHADEMRRVLSNLNPGLLRQHPDYVVRVVSDEGPIGKAHLSHFMELETETPVIVTTSQMLTTGVDVQTCKNVVIVRTVNSMTEFKQIIGRGTRVREDYGKLFFDILDYTGSATTLFADPAFDGEPALITEEEVNGEGEVIDGPRIVGDEDPDENGEEPEPVREDPNPLDDGPINAAPRKYYVDGTAVEIATHLVYDLDAEGRRVEVRKLTDYSAETVRKLYESPLDLTTRWSLAATRAEVIGALQERGIILKDLALAAGQPEVDPLDLLCNLAYDTQLITRKQRTEALKSNTQFFTKYTGEAAVVLMQILEKYSEFGVAEFDMPDIFKVQPLSEHGNVTEIAAIFGGTDQLMQAVEELQTLLYTSQTE
ncbi:DEAD/DEAH box helicase [Granulicella sp. WH15]|nr:DEAD/DEAH box helicase [Granulicella sp. WH15]